MKRAVFSASDKLFDFGALADSVTQIVKLRTSYLTVTDYFNTVHAGRVYRESHFNSAAVSYMTNGKGFRDPAAVL